MKKDSIMKVVEFIVGLMIDLGNKHTIRIFDKIGLLYKVKIIRPFCAKKPKKSIFFFMPNVYKT